MPTSESIDWQQRAQEALSRAEIMVLATVDPDSGTWTSPVQFSAHSTAASTTQADSYSGGDGFVLAFLSRPGTRHGANVNRDPRVAVSIYSWPGPDGGNLGLQITGHAAVDGPPSGGWQPYTIRPTEVWCFDSRIDHHRHWVGHDR